MQLHGNVAFKRGCAAREEVRNQITVQAAIKIGQKHSRNKFFPWTVQEDPLRLPQIYPLPRVHDVAKAPLDARANAVEHLTLLIYVCQCGLHVKRINKQNNTNTNSQPVAYRTPS